MYLPEENPQIAETPLAGTPPLMYRVPANSCYVELRNSPNQSCFFLPLLLLLLLLSSSFFFFPLLRSSFFFPFFFFFFFFLFLLLSSSYFFFFLIMSSSFLFFLLPSSSSFFFPLPSCGGTVTLTCRRLSGRTLIGELRNSLDDVPINLRTSAVGRGDENVRAPELFPLGRPSPSKVSLKDSLEESLRETVMLLLLVAEEEQEEERGVGGDASSCLCLCLCPCLCLCACLCPCLCQRLPGVREEG